MRRLVIIMVFFAVIASVSSLCWWSVRDRLPNTDRDTSIEFSHFATRRVTVETRGDEIRSIAFSPCGRFVATGAADGRIKIWATKSWQLDCTLNAHNEAVSGIGYFGSGSHLVSCGSEGDLVIWNTKGYWEERRVAGFHRTATCLALDPNGEFVVTGGVDRRIKLLPTRVNGAPFELLGHHETVTSLAIAPDSRYIFSGSLDTSVTKWEVATRRISEIYFEHRKGVLSICLLNGGQILASGGADKELIVRKLLDGKLVVHVLRGHTASTTALTSRKGILLSGGLDGTIRAWSARQNLQLDVANVGKPVTSLTLSPDGRFLVAAWENKFAVWVMRGDLAQVVPGQIVVMGVAEL